MDTNLLEPGDVIVHQDPCVCWIMRGKEVLNYIPHEDEWMDPFVLPEADMPVDEAFEICIKQCEERGWL